MKEEKFIYDFPVLLDFNFGAFACGSTEKEEHDNTGDDESQGDLGDE